MSISSHGDVLEKRAWLWQVGTKTQREQGESKPETVPGGVLEVWLAVQGLVTPAPESSPRWQNPSRAPRIMLRLKLWHWESFAHQRAPAQWSQQRWGCSLLRNEAKASPLSVPGLGHNHRALFSLLHFHIKQITTQEPASLSTHGVPCPQVPATNLTQIPTPQLEERASTAPNKATQLLYSFSPLFACSWQVEDERHGAEDGARFPLPAGCRRPGDKQPRKSQGRRLLPVRGVELQGHGGEQGSLPALWL